MHSIQLHPPVVTGQEVAFSWEVTPESALYRKSGFYLRFPETVDLSLVSPALWWRVFLICLHSHWPLLRPCRVQLPVRLSAGEVEFWLRLLDAETATLETNRGGQNFERSIEIICSGEPLPESEPMVDLGRCGTAFSGGKDSLLQVGFLSELSSQPPLLVTTTSPMPPHNDHITPRRKQILAEIGRRCPVTLVEVESDYRSNWENSFSNKLGYKISINEITDTFLYFASLLVVGAASGVNHLFLAAEAEVHENREVNGRTVMHNHYMYNCVVQRALDTLLKPMGLRYCSLTSSLSSMQVQRILWRRYDNLCDLQYSCWRVGPNDAACNQCNQCLRLALNVLSIGKNPSRMGIDLARLLVARKDWKPRPKSSEATSSSPKESVSAELDSQIVRYLQETPRLRVLGALVDGKPGRLFQSQTWKAFHSYDSLKRSVAAAPPSEIAGYRKNFLSQTDERVRDGLQNILSQYYGPELENNYEGIFRRGNALTQWVVEPLVQGTK